jgi:hypothetical protein
MLLATIDEHHRGTYDFLYLPIDFKARFLQLKETLSYKLQIVALCCVNRAIIGLLIMQQNLISFFLWAE